jgi:hypothetical protein
MSDPDAALDALLERLRARALDPERRADVIVDAFSASVRTMDLGSLLGAGRSAAASLGQLLGEIRTTGMPGPESRAQADAIASMMGRPASPGVPPPATAEAVERVERLLGGRLPVVLRRAYLEIADGGFGPGAGLLSLAEAESSYRSYVAESPGPRGSRWPAPVLPLTEREPGHYCVDVSSGRILDWDPEDLRERSSDAVWQRSFSEVASSAEAWLEDWVDSRTQREQAADQMAVLMATSQVAQAREARAHIAAMTPEARAAMGLPEVGWEEIVWGRIGLDDDEDEGRS